MKFLVKNKTLFTYGLTLVNLVAIVLISLLGTSSHFNDLSFNDHIFTTIETMDQITMDLSKSAADVNHYILTNEESYVDSFRQYRDPLEERMNFLEDVFKKNKEQRAKFVMLKQLVNRQIYDLESCVQLKKKSGLIKASEYMQAREQDKCMERIRLLQSDLIEEQKAILKNERQQYEFSLKSREYILISASIAALLISSIAIGTIVTDLNEKREREQYLEAVNKNKDRFFTIISHDLKGPAHNLIGISELLLSDDSLTEEEKSTFIQHLNDTARKNYNLLENLLEWSRIQMGSIVLESQNADLWEIAQETLLITNEAATQKNISIKNKIVQNSLVYADFNCIKTVLRNLISNAVKFTPQDGTVTLSAQESKNTFIVSVKDNGTGMSPEVARNLFKPGKVTSRSGTNGEMGSGIGLLLCKELIEKNHGKIWVESEKGTGTCFYFSLPKA